MKLNADVFLVASGRNGAWITNAFDCHVYLVRLKKSLLLVDSGSGLDRNAILSIIASHRFDIHQVTHILLTHAHADHSGGAAGLKEISGAKVALSAREAKFFETADEENLGLAAARSFGYYPDDYRLRSCTVDMKLGDSEELKIDGSTVTAINLPGHSRGSTCYIIEGDEGRYIFTGDVVFLKGQIGLLNCPGSSLEDYRNNIGKLSALQIDALFPGHGMFCLSNGQTHLDSAVESFKSLIAPPNFIT